MQLLGPDQLNPPTGADRRLGLETLKTAADVAWKVAENERIVAQKERDVAETGLAMAQAERYKAETEKIRVQKG